MATIGATSGSRNNQVDGGDQGNHTSLTSQEEFRVLREYLDYRLEEINYV